MTFFFTKNTPVYSFGYLLESIYMQLKILFKICVLNKHIPNFTPAWNNLLVYSFFIFNMYRFFAATGNKYNSYNLGFVVCSFDKDQCAI